MSPAEFQATKGPELKAFLLSPLGTDLLNALNALKPAYEFPIHEHLMTANRESIRGYEACLKNIIALTMIPKSTTQPEANYGVPDRKPTETK